MVNYLIDAFNILKQQDQGCHVEPVETWWGGLSARTLRQAQGDILFVFFNSLVL